MSNTTTFNLDTCSCASYVYMFLSKCVHGNNRSDEANKHAECSAVISYIPYRLHSESLTTYQEAALLVIELRREATCYHQNLLPPLLPLVCAALSTPLTLYLTLHLHLRTHMTESATMNQDAMLSLAPTFESLCITDTGDTRISGGDMTPSNTEPIEGIALTDVY